MASNCESCEYFDYDEEIGDYVCTIDLDEDEYAGFISGHTRACPYFRAGDEYTIVRKQN